jgi:hypothetical protein
MLLVLVALVATAAGYAATQSAPSPTKSDDAYGSPNRHITWGEVTRCLRAPNELRV